MGSISLREERGDLGQGGGGENSGHIGVVQGVERISLREERGDLGQGGGENSGQIGDYLLVFSGVLSRFAAAHRTTRPPSPLLQLTLLFQF